MYHETVLLQEAVEGLAIKPDGIYVDATFGGGGHSKEILKHLSTGKLFAFDQDEDAQANVEKSENLIFIKQNFRYIKQFLRFHGIKKIDGLLADLGVSWHQFDTPKRGFSIRFDKEVLDMRMDTTTTISAKNILNTYTQAALFDIFKKYGELPNAKRLAAGITTARKLAPIETVAQLKTLADPFVRGKQVQFYAQLFQALRMEVNDEVNALKDLLEQSTKVLNPGGRLVLIAYHSIEDRLVKNFMKKGVFEGEEEKDFYGRSHKPLKTINKRVIVPTQAEIKRNPKSRSAKLRIAEKT